MSSSLERSLSDATENNSSASSDSASSDSVSRRAFMATSAVTSAAATLPIAISETGAAQSAAERGVYRFAGPNADFHGHQWQTLNPGYWKIEEGALRRRLQNYGDRSLQKETLSLEGDAKNAATQNDLAFIANTRKTLLATYVHTSWSQPQNHCEIDCTTRF